MAVSTIVTLIVAAAIAYGVQAFLNFRKAVASIDNHPGYRTMFSWSSVLGLLVPGGPGIVHNTAELMAAKHDFFQSIDCDVYSVVGGSPKAEVVLFVADADLIKEITQSRNRFPKPTKDYTVLNFFGRNIVSSEGEEWKRFRKITAPAFSERNSQLVWEETAKVMNDLFDNVWGDQKVITVDHCVDITLPIALSVIGIAGFGKNISWKDELEIPPGHQITFKAALHRVSIGVVSRMIFPRWMSHFSPGLKETYLAFDELHAYMSEMITERQSTAEADAKTVRHDLFASLLDANSEDDDGKLSHEELIGNIFIFQLAGHETTAHTLAFTFALLALHPDEQEILFLHIKSIVPDRRMPSYSEMPAFTQSLAVFYETLRMFPPVPAIPKFSAEDTIIATTNASGVRTTIPVPQDTNVVVSTTGLHYNPRYWEDPHAFKPARFLRKDWPRDAFLPFSAGTRACLGRKFFETEGLMVLTMMISRYKITLKDEPEYAHESFEQRKARILACKFVLSTTPLRVPLVFTRRDL